MAIELVPLCTLQVQLKPPIEVGIGPARTRLIFEVASARVEGDRLRGEMVGPKPRTGYSSVKRSMPASPARAKRALAVSGPRSSRSKGGNMPTRADAAMRSLASSAPVVRLITALLVMSSTLIRWLWRTMA